MVHQYLRLKYHLIISFILIVTHLTSRVTLSNLVNSKTGALNKTPVVYPLA